MFEVVLIGLWLMWINGVLDSLPLFTDREADSFRPRE